ncbi:hypothetical protein [Wolbachia endosymbiont of Encarsia formosa]|uniref:hypothetical protein n=1 Tax=Wolbachia endosymbiont of Encarsia formosa TaxID=77125 RepID=UPI0031B9C643
MTGEISSNSSGLLSAPLPLSPADWVKNCGQAESNDKNEKTSGSIESENSSSTQPTTVLSEDPSQLTTEQKIDAPILVNTSVGISNAAALKYSIATLLLCISSVTAGIYTYLAISATLSAPVLFIVIASVSSLVVLNLAVYLINSFVSAINSEKGVDPGRKQSQDSGLQKAKGLEHSNTPTSSLPVMSVTPIVPPSPPPPTASKHMEQHKDTNILEETKNKTLKKVEDKLKNDNGRAALFNDIKKVTFKTTMNEEQKRKRDEKIEQSQKKLKEQEKKRKKERENAGEETAEDMQHTLAKKLTRRRTGIAREEENIVQPLNEVYDKISSMIPSPRSRSSSLSSNNSDESWNSDDEYLSSPASELDRKESPDSGHDNIKPELTTPPRSTLKAEKPPIPPKPPNLRVNL